MLFNPTLFPSRWNVTEAYKIATNELINQNQCCFYPYSIETYYEKYVPESSDYPGADVIMLEEYGRESLNSIKVCTNRGEFIDYDLENEEQCTCFFNYESDVISDLFSCDTVSCNRFYLKSSKLTFCL